MGRAAMTAQLKGPNRAPIEKERTPQDPLHAGYVGDLVAIRAVLRGGLRCGLGDGRIYADGAALRGATA